MTNQESIQLLSVVVALTAVVVGPLISLRVAKKQIDSSKAVADLQARANVLSKNRQDWINTLRIEIAGFIASATMVLPMLLTQKDSLEMHKLLSQLALHLAKTKLLINPEEEDHRILISKMEDVANHVFSFKGQPHELTGELVGLAQKVLKREWERVKAFS